MVSRGDVYVENLVGHFQSGTFNQAPAVTGLGAKTVTATPQKGSVTFDTIFNSGCAGRSLPGVQVGFSALHTKYEDKWLLSEDILWPNPESSVRGTEKCRPALIAPTHTVDLDMLTKQFTDSVHHGRLVSFLETSDLDGSDKSVDSQQRDVSVRTAPATFNTPKSSPLPTAEVTIRPSTPTAGGASKVCGFLTEAPEPIKYSVYACFDGHNGHEAPEYLMHVFRKLLHARLPELMVLPQKGTPAFAKFLCDIRHAVARAIVVAERNFAAGGHLSGSTVTICVLVDWVLTVVNLGDSTCFLDNGESVYAMSEDHNLEASPSELKRVQDAGVLVARLSVNLDGPAKEGSTGLGPMRCWPGGLCLSRTFGDFDAPDVLVSAPFIKQVLLPERGCRIVLASDGLWAIQKDEHAREVIRKSRSMTADKAASFLVNKARTNFGLKDDVSVIVVDVLPKDLPTFSTLFPKQKRSAGGFSCFCGSPAAQEPEETEVDPRRARSSTVEVLAQVDYGDPPISSREARALHDDLTKCKRESYKVFKLAMEQRRLGQNPLKSAEIQALCRSCAL